ncbi:MAG TPA: hypothetical protein VNM90_29745 [Haliangium sp.]|nr:hypothetical protein [Haliangium sp.]
MQTEDDIVTFAGRSRPRRRAITPSAQDEHAEPEDALVHADRVIAMPGNALVARNVVVEVAAVEVAGARRRTVGRSRPPGSKSS